MEIKRIGENKVRCALTEEEIHELGFDIDEIIGNTETTQRFMRVVLELIEEQEHINVEQFSPMVKAELLQNHSMAITFGGDSDFSFKDLVDTMSRIANQLEPKVLEELKAKAAQESQEENRKVQGQQTKKKNAEPMICALCFDTLEDMRRMTHVCFPRRVPLSSLYKMQDKYYLILNFDGFTKEDMRPFAFGTVEYDDAHYSDMGQIAHIMEHGLCIMKKSAIETLMQL